MSKVLLFLAEGFEETEAVTIADILRRGSVDLQTVSITGNKLVTGSHGITLISDLLFEEAPIQLAQMLVLPGGVPGTNNLNAHQGLRQALMAHHAKGALLAAICAAPMVLGQLGILQGRQAICYPSYEPQLMGAHLSGKTVVTDGHITTGRSAGAAMDFALCLLEQLTDTANRNKVEAALVR